MNEWSEGNLEVRSPDGKRSVVGLISRPFGIHFDANRKPPGWVVVHVKSGMLVAGWQPFRTQEIAKEFVARIQALADWDNIDPECPPDLALEVDQIADELICDDPLTELMRIPPYIGDDAFRAFLEEHDCPTNIETIRMRFLGAAVSPGREADIHPLIGDFFEYDMPELSGREQVGFLHTFLGLFNDVREGSLQSPVSLSPAGSVVSRENIKELLYRRIDEVAFGFLEGVWENDEKLPLTEVQAALLTEMEETALRYDVLLANIFQNDGSAEIPPVVDLLREIAEIDRHIEARLASLLGALRDDVSSTRPMKKRAKTLIDELSFAEGLPRDAIRECIARRDEMVPIFLSILRHHAAVRPAIDDRENALFFIIHILAELGEQQAFAPLIDLLAGTPERVEAVLGDAITENLAQILISIFDGDTDRFYRLMNNAEVDEYVRSAAFEAWTYYVAAGRIDRAEAKQYLSSGLTSLQPQWEHYVWVAWADSIARLGFKDLKWKVLNAFDIERIPPMAMDFSFFEDILEEASSSEALLAFIEKKRLKPFSDTIAVLSKWYCFSEEYQRKKRPIPAPALPTIPAQSASFTNPFRNVGRNDPCPCGSGKKFKKCCLN